MLGATRQCQSTSEMDRSGGCRSQRGVARWLTTVLLALASCVVIGGASQTVEACPTTKTKNEYTIHFLGVDNHPDGSSTWNYTLVWNGGGHLPDYWVLELCNTAQVVASSPAHDSVAFDGATGVYGILWQLDGSYPVNTPVPFSVTLDRQYKTEKSKWAVRTTGNVRKDDICGPSKACNILNPLPIEALVCMTDSPCACEVLVSWDNQEPSAHAILIAVDGIVVDILPGTATSTTLTLPDNQPHDICVRVVFDPSDFEGQAGCQPCAGKVSQLTLQYNGNAPAQITVKDSANVTVFDQPVAPGEQFSFTGSGSGGSLGTNTQIRINGVLHTTIHTSCSQPIGPGFVSGDFLVVSGASTDGGPLCPLPDCNECDGKVNNLTLQYNGAAAATILVKDSANATVFNGTVQPGEQFSFMGTGSGGSLGTNTQVFVNGVLHATIHTSCSQEIGPGFVAGDFLVTAGSSTEGGALCPVPSCNECDGKVNNLTLQYDGQVPALVTVRDSTNTIVYNATVNPGEQFSFTGTGSGGSLGTNTTVHVDGVLHTTFHTSCSQPIGPGMVRGSFTVIEGTSTEGGPLCPVPSCGACKDKVSELTLEYAGMGPVLVEVRQANNAVVFSGNVNNGEQFSFVGTDNGSFGNNIKIFIGGLLHVEVHTSCSQPIGPGLIFGSFQVIAGASKNGGPLCPFGPIGEEISCDQDIDGASACVCCTVQCVDVPTMPPADLTCTPDSLDCGLSVTWTNPTQYASITVLLDGVLVATLPGDATSYTFPPSVLSGTVCLEGETICGTPFTPVCCTVSCMIPPPPPVTNLTCTLLDVCTCEFTMSWTNGAADYDSIRILIDGMLMANLPGDATTITFNLPGPAPHDLCVVPVRLGVTGTPVCCAAQCPDIPANSPMGLTCVVGPPPACEVSLSWMNSSQYQAITVSLDGVVVLNLPGSTQNATLPLPGRGNFQICLNGTTICGVPFAEVCCLVDCPFPPPPPFDLTCTLVDVCTCEVLLSWTNGANDYDAIQVYLNGLLNVVLPGSQQVLSLFLPSAGDFDICLVAVRNTLPSTPSTCCSVSCPSIPALPPSMLACVPDLSDCSVDITWTNGSQYAGIQVLLDGVVVQNLPGDATGTSVPGPLTGMHTVCLQGTTICGAAFPEVCCSFECNFPPPRPIIDLDCTLTDVCTGAVSLTWTNGAADYDTIELSINGAPTSTLPGSATGTTLNLPGAGTFDICLTPVRNGVSGPQACCMVTAPETGALPPVMLICDVNPLTCETVLTWINQSLYSVIEVVVNGVVVQTLPGNAVMATVILPLPGLNEICLQGQTVCSGPFPSECCSVTCIIPPPPPTDLLCQLTDECTCAVQLSWLNGAVYDAVEVLVDGLVVATLPGNATSHSLNLAGPGPANICVRGVLNQVNSAQACCAVTCTGVATSGAADLTCAVGLPPACEVLLSWTNTTQVATITVLLDGVVVLTLPGTATSAMVNLPDSNPHQICLGGTNVCGAPLAEVCCSVQCGSFPPPVDLSCSLTNPCSCTAQLTWTNGAADYDDLEVYRAGVLVATLPGNATSFTPAPLTAGGPSVEFCVIAIRGGLPSAADCCSLSCPAAPLANPPSNLQCSISDMQTCEALLSWTNNSSYSEIQVIVNGAPFQVLPGTATNVTLSGIPFIFGVRTICVMATTTCGAETDPVCCQLMCNQEFIRGDCNIDGIIDLADAIKVMRVLFVNLPVGSCVDACDFNDDGFMDISDMIYLVNYIFLMGPPPPAPWMICGLDATPDSLDCAEFDLCP